MLSSARQIAQPACPRCRLRQVITGLRISRLPAPARTPHRIFSTSRTGRQEAAQSQDDQRIIREGDQGYTYRHIQPHGQVVGKPGRRQRASSEALTTQSLGKPAEVLVFRDIIEDPADLMPRLAKPGEFEDEEDGDGQAGLSAEEIEAAIAHGAQTPKEQEVNESISRLRPETHVLQKDEFERLAKTLFESYSARQLQKYLVLHSRLSPNAKARPASERATRAAEKTIPVTQWRPGKTPLEERLALISLDQPDVARSKVKLVDQILRFAWHVAIDIEVQAVGELELQCTPWQIKLLFDVTHKGLTNVERFVKSALLVQSCEVRPWRPGNVVRITARQHDAEEVSQRLQKNLAEAGRLFHDMNVFKPLLGSATWPNTLNELFDEEDIKYVSNATNSAILLGEDGILSLYSVEKESRHNARRLLLSLLDLPYRKVSDQEADHTFARSLATLDVPRGLEGEAAYEEYPTHGLNRRHHDHDLRRFQYPLQSPGTEAAPVRLQHGPSPRRVLAEQLGKGLGSFEPHPRPRPESLQTSSVWDRWATSVMHFGWVARFCVLLQSFGKKDLDVTRPKITSTSSHVKLHRTPGLVKLLSYLEPVLPSASIQDKTSHGKLLRFRPPDAIDHGWRRLKVIFRPSPFQHLPENLAPPLEEILSLPAVELVVPVYERSSRSEKAGGLTVGHNKGRVRIVRHEHEIAIPVPLEVADIVFGQDTVSSIWANQFATVCRDMRTVIKDVEAAVEGAEHEDYDATGGGSGLRLQKLKDEIRIKMPMWMFPSTRDATAADVWRLEEEHEFFYLLDRVELLREWDFNPPRDPDVLEKMDRSTKHVMENWPKGLVLRVREVEQGMDGGSFPRGRTEVELRWSDRAEDLETAEERFNKPYFPEREEETTAEKQEKEALGRKFVATATSLVTFFSRAEAGKVGYFDANGGIGREKEIQGLDLEGGEVSQDRLSRGEGDGGVGEDGNWL
jgi:hypothetical protein